MNNNSGWRVSIPRPWTHDSRPGHLGSTESLAHEVFFASQLEVVNSIHCRLKAVKSLHPEHAGAVRIARRSTISAKDGRSAHTRIEQTSSLALAWTLFA